MLQYVASAAGCDSDAEEGPDRVVTALRPDDAVVLASCALIQIWMITYR